MHQRDVTVGIAAVGDQSCGEATMARQVCRLLCVCCSTAAALRNELGVVLSATAAGSR